MTLSRCAHCGAVAHYAKSVTDPHLCWSIQCSDCGISTPSYSQQEMAADTWNHTALAYAHRNGETTAPTMPGAYWFKGRCHARDIVDLTPVMVTDDHKILAWLPGWDGGQFEEIGYFAGRWWGPVIAPWEPS